MAIARPPAHLKAAGRQLWRRILADFELSEHHHLVLLQTACEAMDRLTEARELIDKAGLTVLDRYEVPKLHPAISVEQVSRQALIRCLRELSLDAAVEEYSRPPMIAGGRRYGRRAG